MIALGWLLNPRSIVLIGGDTELTSIVRANLAASTFREIHFVNTDGPEPTHRSHASVEQLPVTPDLAVICTHAAAAAEAFDQAGRKGIKGAVVMTFDPDGYRQDTTLKRQLRAVAEHHGCRFLGPGSAGLHLPAIGLNASWMSGGLVAGKLALVSQSGSVAAGAVQWGASHGVGL